jgi:hypothetical protein
LSYKVYLHHSGVDYPSVVFECEDYDDLLGYIGIFWAMAKNTEDTKTEFLERRIRVVQDGQEDNPFFLTWEEEIEDEEA